MQRTGRPAAGRGCCTRGTKGQGDTETQTRDILLCHLHVFFMSISTPLCLLRLREVGDNETTELLPAQYIHDLSSPLS